MLPESTLSPPVLQQAALVLRLRSRLPPRLPPFETVPMHHASLKLPGRPPILLYTSSGFFSCEFPQPFWQEHLMRSHLDVQVMFSILDVCGEKKPIDIFSSSNHVFVNQATNPIYKSRLWARRVRQHRLGRALAPHSWPATFYLESAPSCGPATHTFERRCCARDHTKGSLL